MRFPAASLLLLSALLLGCDLFFHNPKNENGQFLAEPINLSDFNSEFDDYNSALPSNKYGVVPLIFSSKRALKTKFNLVYEVLNLGYDEQAKRLTANNRPYGGLDVIQTYAPLARLVSSIQRRLQRSGAKRSVVRNRPPRLGQSASIGGTIPVPVRRRPGWQP